MINFIYHFITYKSNNLIWLIGSNGCKILTCEYYLFKYKVHTVFFERLCNVLSSLKYYFFNYSDLTIFLQHLQYAFYTTSYVQYKITIIPGAIILLFWKEQPQLLIALNSKQTTGQPTMMQWQGPPNIPAVAAKGMKKKWKWNFNRSEKIPDSINCYQGFFFWKLSLVSVLMILFSTHSLPFTPVESSRPILLWKGLIVWVLWRCIKYGFSANKGHFNQSAFGHFSLKTCYTN